MPLLLALRLPVSEALSAYHASGAVLRLKNPDTISEEPKAQEV